MYRSIHWMKDNKSFLSSASLISALTSVGTPFSFPQAHRKPFGWKATTARCPCWSPRLPCSCSPLAALELYVNKSAITAIILLILRSFQRKGLCNSGLKAKRHYLCTQYNNNTFKVTKWWSRSYPPVESRIMSIRGNQIMIDRDLAELYGVETKRLNEAVKRNIELLILE